MPSGFGTCVNNESVTAAAQADTDYATLRGDLFKAAGLAGEGDAVWQAFILGGEAYRDHVAAHDYPSDGDTCLYCQQVLGPEALTLLRRYRAFANDAARERAAAARRIATTLSRNVAAIDQAITRQEVLRHPRSLLNPPDDTPFVRQPHVRLSCNPRVDGGVVTERQIVIAAEIRTTAADFGHLEPIITAARKELKAAGVQEEPEIALADAGYWHQKQMESLVSDGIQILIRPDGDQRKGTRPGWNGGYPAFMRRVLEADPPHPRSRRRVPTRGAEHGRT